MKCSLLYNWDWLSNLDIVLLKTGDKTIQKFHKNISKVCGLVESLKLRCISSGSCSELRSCRGQLYLSSFWS